MSLKHSVVKFKFEDFESLSTDQDVQVSSENVTDCHGNIWMLNIYPGGRSSDSNYPGSEEGMVHMSLYNEGTKDVRVRPTFIVRGARGELYYEGGINILTFDVGGGWGRDVIKRSKILDKENNILLDGALLVDVHIQLQPEPKSLTVPPSPHSKNMLKLLDDSESADVKFKVKRTIITAHKLILKTNAPILYDFCKGGKEGEMIKIDKISPAIFKIILRYVYGGEIPGKETILSEGNDSIGGDIIDAADRFGIVSLKLAIETILVENLVFSTHNVAEWIVFAESKTCPLIKEAAFAFFIARATDLLHSESTKEVLKDSPELMAELMEEMSKSFNTDTRFDGRERSMSVIELRKKLGEKGLDLDGSKEILVSRLEESNKRQRTE